MPRAKRHPKLNRADTIRVYLWVAQHLGDEEPPIDEAPPGAAHLLNWIKEGHHETEFYTRMLPKCTPPEATLKKLDEGEEDAAATHTNRLKAWLADMDKETDDDGQ